MTRLGWEQAIIEGQEIKTLSIAKTQIDSEMACRKINSVRDNCLAVFRGMDMARDRLCSMARKKQTTIEGNADCRWAMLFDSAFCVSARLFILI